jgi:hypothetical protein
MTPDQYKKLLARLIRHKSREAVARDAMTVELPKLGNRQAKGRPVLVNDESYRFQLKILAHQIDTATAYAREQGHATPTDYAYGHVLNRDPTATDYESVEAYAKERKALERKVVIGRTLVRKQEYEDVYPALYRLILAGMEKLPPWPGINFDPTKLRKKKSRV